MRRISLVVVIVALVATGLLLGCVGKKVMDVSVRVSATDVSATPVEDGQDLKAVAHVVAVNNGSAGYATIKVELYDDEDNVFASKSERVHLDKGETKKFDVTVETKVAADFDYEAVYALASVEKTEPD